MAIPNQRLLKVARDAIEEDDIASKRLKSSNEIASSSENSSRNNAKLLNELLPPRQVVTVSTRNRYDALAADIQHEEKNSDNDQEMEEPEVLENPRKITKAPIKPKPLVVHTRPTSTTRFEIFIEKLVGAGNFRVKYTPSRTTIQCTYTSPEDRKFAKIIYNFYTEKNEEEILALINTDDLDASKVSKLRNTKEPVYLVLFNRHFTLGDLRKHHPVVGSTTVRWAQYSNKREMAQC